MLRHAVATLTALSLLAGQASAATLIVNQGLASVSRGDGYVAAPSGTEVGPGDKVVVKPNGSATIVYSPACQIPVAAGEVVTIAATIPCSVVGGIPTATYVIGGVVIAGGIGAAIALSGDKSHSP